MNQILGWLNVVLSGVNFGYFLQNTTALWPNLFAAILGFGAGIWLLSKD